jgi:hypothetical protein
MDEIVHSARILQLPTLSYSAQSSMMLPKFYLIILFIKMVIFCTDVYFVQFHCHCFQSIPKLPSLQRYLEQFYDID